MQTERDKRIVEWIGRLGAAGAEQVMERFAMGRSWAYERLSGLVTAGLLEQRMLLYRQPGLYLATAEGLRWCGLERLGVYRVGPGGFQHASEIARVAVALERSFQGWRLLGEREIRDHERQERVPIATATLGEPSGGRAPLHRPDLALVSAAGEVIAIEVELSVKAPVRLRAICSAWARARHVTMACYLATPAPARAVQRAIAETRSADRIAVVPIERVRELSAVVPSGVISGAPSGV